MKRALGVFALLSLGTLPGCNGSTTAPCVEVERAVTVRIIVEGEPADRSAVRALESTHGALCELVETKVVQSCTGLDNCPPDEIEERWVCVWCAE